MALALADVRMKGWEALVKELGYANATKFILMYESGKGNYTKERAKFLGDITLERIFEEVKKRRNL